MPLVNSNQIYLQSACWAIAKSWLDFQVDSELAHLQPERLDQITSTADAIDGSPAHGDGAVQPSSGPGSWPLQVSNQQPRQLLDLIQKLHSGYIFYTSFITLNFLFLQCCILVTKV